MAVVDMQQSFLQVIVSHLDNECQCSELAQDVYQYTVYGCVRMHLAPLIMVCKSQSLVTGSWLIATTQSRVHVHWGLTLLQN